MFEDQKLILLMMKANSRGHDQDKAVSISQNFMGTLSRFQVIERGAVDLARMGVLIFTTQPPAPSRKGFLIACPYVSVDSYIVVVLSSIHFKSRICNVSNVSYSRFSRC